MKEIFSELGLDELGSVAGGRSSRQSELDEYMEIYRRYRARQIELKELKAYDEQIALRNEFMAASKRWNDDIRASSEDSDDFHFSDYYNI